VRQPEAPRKAEPTSPEPETLIEELDEEDGAEVSEIVGEKDEDKEDYLTSTGLDQDQEHGASGY
jgi:hypothetical protein